MKYIEIINEPTKNDVIVFTDKGWKAVSKSEFLQPVNIKIATLQEDNIALQEKFDELVEKINVKLKDYHDILQILTKEEE